MFFNKKAKLLKQKEEELLITQTELFNSKQELNNVQSELLHLKEILRIAQNDIEKGKDELGNCIKSNIELQKKYSPLIIKDDILQERQDAIEETQGKLKELNDKYLNAIKTHSRLENEINLYEESLEIGSFGLYKPMFSFDISEKYKLELEDNYEKQKQLIKEDTAIICRTEWTVGGSKVEGRKMTNQYKKLMLFAFNGECDSLIAKVKWNNATKTKERIIKAFENVNKLGATQNVDITKNFLSLKLLELALTYEYEQKKYEEKEEQRRIREQMRDEEKAQREMERAQKEAEDEERRFQKALDKAKQELGSTTQANMDILKEQINSLEQKLQESHDKKERAIALAQLTKVGHIYIISNLGSFGEDVYKIGMTRRLDPIDRVKELGDASVPFHFDIHAVIYSENAPQLEYELHQEFRDRRINRINNKKEFFKVTLDEIETFINKHTNAEIEFTKLAEAREYRETLTLIEQLNKLVEPPKVETKFPTSLI